MARLAEQLLAFSRRLMLRLEPVDLGELICGLAPRLREVVPPTVAVKWHRSRRGLGRWRPTAAQVEEG